MWLLVYDALGASCVHGSAQSTIQTLSLNLNLSLAPKPSALTLY